MPPMLHESDLKVALGPLFAAPTDMASATTYPLVAALLNTKGGVGKTTTAIALADADVHEEEGDILIIDGDPAQSSITQYLFGNDKKFDRTIETVMTDPRVTIDEVAVPYNHPDPSVKGRIYLVPGSKELGFASERFAPHGTNVLQFFEVVRHAIATSGRRFRRIYIDMGPTWGPVNDAFLYAATKIVVPLVPEPQAINSMRKLFEILADVNRRVQRPGFQTTIAAIVINMTDLPVHKMFGQLVRDSIADTYVTPTTIPSMNFIALSVGYLMPPITFARLHAAQLVGGDDPDLYSRAITEIRGTLR